MNESYFSVSDAVLFRLSEDGRVLAIRYKDGTEDEIGGGFVRKSDVQAEVARQLDKLLARLADKPREKK